MSLKFLGFEQKQHNKTPLHMQAKDRRAGNVGMAKHEGLQMAHHAGRALGVWPKTLCTAHSMKLFTCFRILVCRENRLSGYTPSVAASKNTSCRFCVVGHTFFACCRNKQQVPLATMEMVAGTRFAFFQVAPVQRSPVSFLQYRHCKNVSIPIPHSRAHVVN